MQKSIFLQNKYTTYYFNIINAAKGRVNTNYVERHHIIPKSLGGTHDTINLIKLTAREHFICHLLLTKMLTGKEKSKMVYAVWRMCNSNKYKITSRTYAIVRKDFAEVVRNRIISIDTRKKISAIHKGKPKSPVQAAKNRILFKGKSHSVKTKLQMGTKRKTFQWYNDGKIQTMSDKHPGIGWTNGRLYKTRTTRKIICPHCGKQGGGGNMPRYHFDNCKAKSSISIDN